MVDGSEYEDDADDVHQGRDESRRREDEDEAEDGAADAHDGECRLFAGHEVSLGVVDFILADVTLRPEIGDARDDARGEEEHADGHRDACHRVIGKLNQQNADNNSAQRAENGTL